MTRRFCFLSFVVDATGGHDSGRPNGSYRRGLERPYCCAVRPTLVYNLIAAATWPLLYGLFRLRSTGKEHIPAGGYVLACNHLSSFDPWPLGMPLWPTDVPAIMAKSELYWFPLNKVIDAAGAFPVRRGPARHRRDRDRRQPRARGERRRDVPGRDAPRQRADEDARSRGRGRGAARIALEAGVPARARRGARHRPAAAAPRSFASPTASRSTSTTCAGRRSPRLRRRRRPV